MKVQDYFRSLPVLQGDGFILRPVKAEDRDSLWAYLNDPDISAFTTWEYHRDIAATEAYLQFVLGNYACGQVENWGVQLTGQEGLVGMIGFGSVNEYHGNGEVGFVLARKLWGRGITSKALGLVVREGFGSLGLQKIIGRSIAENEGSKRVFEKAGFTREGYLRKQYLKRNAFRDIVLYGLLKETL